MDMTCSAVTWEEEGCLDGMHLPGRGLDGIRCPGRGPVPSASNLKKHLSHHPWHWEGDQVGRRGRAARLSCPVARSRSEGLMWLCLYLD